MSYQYDWVAYSIVLIGIIVGANYFKNFKGNIATPMLSLAIGVFFIVIASLSSMNYSGNVNKMLSDIIADVLLLRGDLRPLTKILVTNGYILAFVGLFLCVKLTLMKIIMKKK